MGDPVADADNHSGRLVAQHRREQVAALDEGKVAVADAAVTDRNAHLAGAGVGHIKIADQLKW